MRCSSFRATTSPFAKDRFVEARIGLLVSAGESFSMRTTPLPTTQIATFTLHCKVYCLRRLRSSLDGPRSRKDPQRLAWLFVCQLCGREISKFFVNQRQQLLGRVAVSGLSPRRNLLRRRTPE